MARGCHPQGGICHAGAGRCGSKIGCNALAVLATKERTVFRDPAQCGRRRSVRGVAGFDFVPALRAHPSGCSRQRKRLIKLIEIKLMKTPPMLPRVRANH
jgi:hypothetical protein